jgi:predicted nucleic acid-binding Zn ribbon protein
VERLGNLIGGIPKKDPSSESSPQQQSSVRNQQGAPFKRYPSEHGPLRRRRPGVATDFAKIKGILAKALAHKGIDKKIERYEFILHWDKIVGERLAEVSKPEYISRRVLLVRVLHPVWAQEFTFMKSSLLVKLAPYLKVGDIVEDMIFRVGPLEE